MACQDRGTSDSLFDPKTRKRETAEDDRFLASGAAGRFSSDSRAHRSGDGPMSRLTVDFSTAFFERVDSNDKLSRRSPSPAIRSAHRRLQ